MGCVGISGLAKNKNAQTEEKDHCPEDILSTDDAETLHGEMAFAIMAWSIEIQDNCNVAT